MQLFRINVLVSIFISELLLKVDFAYGYRFKRNSVDRDSLVLLKTVAAAFDNRSGDGHWPCGIKVFSQHQRSFCSREPALAFALEDAKKLALANCQRVFRYSPWNCLLPKEILHTNTVYRETAFLYALFAAALSDRISHACNTGQLKLCNCIQTKNLLHQSMDDVGNYRFDTGGKVPCSAYSTRFVRRFLKIFKSENNQINRMHRDNALIGLKEYLRNLKRFCYTQMDKCVTSESKNCVKKVCWSRPGKFTDVVDKLKEHYHRAHQKSIDNNLMRRHPAEEGQKYYSNFQFIQDSPDYCDETQGLICENELNCLTLCCGRGYTMHTMSRASPCRCKWNDKSENYHLVCDNCVAEVQVYKCN